MGKALVIKNADFSANAVTTITFEEEVPCTNVAFDSDTVTLDALGTASIGYTITPNNTTDIHTLVSSDQTVLTVNGTTITAVGIGVATLTLTCGSHSATCTVTVSIIESPILLIGRLDSVTADNTSAVCVNGSTARLSCFGDYNDGNFNVELPIYDNAFFDPGDLSAIKIPQNATAIHIEADHTYGSGELVYFVDGNTSLTDSNGHVCVPSILEYALTPTTVSGVRYINEDVPIPESANGYIVVIRVANSSTLSEITSESDLVTYADNTHHLTISYKAS